MPDFTQANRPFRLTTPLGPDVLLCGNWQATEQISSLWELRIEAWSPRRDIVGAELLGQAVTLACDYDGQPVRHFHGIVRRLERIPPPVDAPLTGYVLTVVPPAWAMTLVQTCESFGDMSVREIVDDVCGGFDLPAADWSLFLRGHDHKWPCRVQWNETSWAFVNRLCERSGIWYGFQSDANSCTMFFGDEGISAQVRNGAARIADAMPGVPPLLSVSMAQIPSVDAIRVVTSHHKFTTTDNVERKKVGQTNGPDPFVIRPSGPGKLELVELVPQRRRYEPLAGHEADDLTKTREDTEFGPGDVLAITANRDAFAAAGASGVLRGTSRAVGLTPGANVDMAIAADPQYDGTYFLLAVHHSGGNGAYVGGEGSEPHYENGFDAMPASGNQWKPPMRTPWPVVPGVVPATVVGPTGEEFYTDKYGRVRILFDWDVRRYEEKTGLGDCWVRVALPFAGPGYGAFFLPRVGHQVLVSFASGNPDAPYVVGSLHNAQNPPFQKLPDQQTQTGIRTRSTPKGDAKTYNELRFDDKKGSEHVWFRAQSQFTGWVTNNVTFHIEQGNQVVTHRKGNRTLTHDEGDDTHTMTKGNHTLALDEGSMSVTVKQGGYKLEADKDATIMSMEENAVVAGKKNVALWADTGNATVKAKQGNAKLQAELGNAIVDGSSEVTIKCGTASITLTPTQINIEVGGSTLRLTPSAIELKGITLSIEGEAATRVASSGPTLVKGNPTLVG